jgi:hypothetical protein
VVTSKAVLPVNLPGEYQKMVEPSPSVTVLPMDVATVEPLNVETTTDPEVVTTEYSTTASTIGSYKHEHPVAEGRAAKFTPEEIETMKQRLREMLKQRENPDLVYQESRIRKAYKSTEATTTTSKTTRRSRFSKKESTGSTTTAAPVGTRPPIFLMHKFDTRNRQNFLKSVRTTTTAPITTPTSTTTESMDFEDDEVDEEEDEDEESQPDTDVAESAVVKQVAEVPKPLTRFSSTRSRFRFRTSTTVLPRTRKTLFSPATTTTEHTHSMKMVILDDVSNQISEKKAQAMQFKGSTLHDFYFEKEDKHVPPPETTERAKRAPPVYEGGFVPMIFN